MAFEQAPHRTLLVADAPLGLGHVEDAMNGPQIGREPLGHRPASQDLRQLGQLLARHAGGSTGSWDGPEGGGSAFFEGAVPFVHGHRRHGEPTSHLGLGDPGVEKADSLETTFLERCGIAALLVPPIRAKGKALPGY